MKLEILALCEYASCLNQRLTILHTFDNWTTKTFPADVSGFCVAKLRFDPDECGRDYSFAFRATDPDGTVVFVQAFSAHPTTTEDALPYQLTQILHIRMKLPPGPYELGIFSADACLATTPFHVLSVS